MLGGLGFFLGQWYIAFMTISVFPTACKQIHLNDVFLIKWANLIFVITDKDKGKT